MFTGLNARTGNQKLQDEGRPRDLDGLVRVMDKIAEEKLTDQEKLTLTTLIDAAIAGGESSTKNLHDGTKLCQQAVEQMKKQYNETQSQMQAPKHLPGTDPKCCSMEFWQISGAIFWSLLGLGLSGVCIWKLCIRC